MRLRTWIILIVVLGAIGGGAYLYLQRSNQSSNLTNLRTTAVTTGTITENVSASGSVSSKQSAELDWQTSGQVDKVDTQVGQSVQAGQELANLNPTTVSPSVLNANQTLVDAKNNLQTLQDSTQSSLSVSQAQQTLANAQKSYNDAKNALSAQQVTTNGDQTTIKQYQADLTLAQEQLQKLQDTFGDLSKISPTNRNKAQKVLRLTQAEQKVQTAQYNLDWAEGHPASVDVSVAQANLAVANSQLEDAQKQLQQAKDGVSADQLAAAQAAVDAAQATVNEVNITAPFSGTVTAVDIQPGDLVSSGTPAFQIDNLSALYVDVSVSEVDINKIQLNQPVQLTFAAVPNKTYDGKVTSIGLVGTNSQGVVNYTVTVQLTDADAQVKPGMTAAVSIVVAKDTNVLLVPNQAVRVVGNQHYVTVLYQGQLIPVTVTVGITNNTTSEITGGQLKAGDEVVLNAPASSSSSFGGRGGPGGIPFRGFGG